MFFALAAGIQFPPAARHRLRGIHGQRRIRCRTNRGGRRTRLVDISLRFVVREIGSIEGVMDILREWQSENRTVGTVRPRIREGESTPLSATSTTTTTMSSTTSNADSDDVIPDFLSPTPSQILVEPIPLPYYRASNGEIVYVDDLPDIDEQTRTHMRYDAWSFILNPNLFFPRA